MNKLDMEKKTAAVGMLCEGSSIRSVERITGIHRDTVMRLGVRIGEGCRRIMDDKMRNLSCRLIQVDEIPVIDLISTSHVEKQNHTLRMHCRRLTRLTNAFSKKIENFKAAVALHYGYYNFVKINGAIRCTPAMAAGVTDTLWTVRDVLELVAARATEYRTSRQQSK